MRIFFSFFLLVITAGYCKGQPLYNFIKIFPIPGEGGWDNLAINPVNKNLYISHGNEVSIFTGQGEPVATIPNTTGVHSIAFASEYNAGYISNGKLNTVSVFDINTNEVKAQVHTGDDPDAIIYDDGSKKILVGNGKSSSLSVISPDSNAVMATILLGGKPKMIVTDEQGRIFVNLEDKNEVVVISKRYEVIAHWPLGKGKGPTGLAINRDTHRLFVGCDKLLVVLNTIDGSIVENMAIGSGCDGVVYDPDVKEIYTANGEGTLSIIQEITADKYILVRNVPTQKGARTLVLDRQQKRIYLPTADFKTGKPDAKGKSPKPQPVAGTMRVLVYAR